MWFQRGAFSLRTYTTTLTLVCLRLCRSFYSQSIANMLFACAQNAHLLVYLPFTLSALILHLLRLRKMVVTAWHVYVRTRVHDVRLRITRFVQHFQPQPRVGGDCVSFQCDFCHGENNTFYSVLLHRNTPIRARRALAHKCSSCERQPRTNRIT